MSESARSSRRWAGVRGVVDGHPPQRELPVFVPPMLATLVEPHALPAGWIYEPKLDGVRVQARVAPSGVHLMSRNRIRQDDYYPELIEGLESAVEGFALLDGEVVAPDPNGGPASFSRLQQRMHKRDVSPALQRAVPVQLWLFDCLHYEGRDLTSQPWSVRRQVLEHAVSPNEAIRLTPVLEGSFTQLFTAACRAGEEGLIGKRAGSPYRPRRSPDWVKLKCLREEDFVVGGWSEPQGSRSGFGALLLGYYEGTQLRYAGKVGTGFDQETIRLLSGELRRRERRLSPFSGPGAPRGARLHWTRPELVVRVGFAEWTDDGRLRHPRFLGMTAEKREARNEKRGTAIPASD